MEKSSVKVNIMGMEYALKADVNPDYIQELASYVNNKMQRLNSGAPTYTPLKIAVLSAVNISDELFRMKRKYENLVKEIESTSEEITEKLDQFLEQYSDLLK
jgi:cell division protein ZapA